MAGFCGLEYGSSPASGTDRLRRESHAETVGILICGSKNEHTVRYSLGRVTTPMALASYAYDALPAEVRQDLPDADRLTAALDWTEEAES